MLAARSRFSARVTAMLAVCTALLLPSFAPAANILWVSDFFTDNTFSPPGTDVNDTNFITMLQNAGHNVFRFNPPASQNTALTAAQITAINTNDLVIIGRASDSAAYQAGVQANQWNTNITRPMIVQSCYLLRASRMGWFTGETVPDSTPGPMMAVNLADPETAYLFAGVALSGNNTVDPFEVAVDRNTSVISSAPVAGGTVLARTVAGTVGAVIVEFPAGTVVRSGTNVLAGYRMFFGSGSREAASPGGVVNSGKDNLTPTGWNIFLRAVTLALNNGNVPVAPGVPADLTADAFSAKIELSWSASVAAAGYYIKRSTTSGGPYINIATNGTGTSYADLTVINGTTNYYVVSAFNTSGQSANSLEVVGIPRAAPTNVVAIGGTNQISLIWNALAGVDYYTVDRSSSASGPFLTVRTDFHGTNYVDAFLTAGQVYYYRVKGEYNDGEYSSGHSETASAATAPGASTLNTVRFATTVLRLGWTSGGAVVSQYFVETSPDGVNFSPLATLPGAALSYTNSGLALDTVYCYRVQGMNSGGFSSYSNITTNRTPVGGYNINIANSGNSSQNANPAPVPPGYLVDEGEVFGDRTNGFFYGWTTLGGTNITRDSRRRESALSPDVRYDTGNQFMKNNVNNVATAAYWEFALPNGFYSVHVVSGDAGATDSVFQFNIEGTVTAALSATNVGLWAEFTNSVSVSDGRLTIGVGPQAVNHKFCFVDIYPAVPVPPVFSMQPQPASVEQSRPVALTGIIGSGSPTLAYQWYLGDVPVAGATSNSLDFAHAQPGDSGNYHLVVTNYAGSVTSDIVALTVTPDTTPPYIVSIGSLNGTILGVLFNEEVDAIIANEPSNFSIDGGSVIATNAVLQPDGRSVKLIVDGTLSGAFRVDVYDMLDLAGQYAPVSGTNSVVLGYAGADIGGPALPGTHVTFDNENIQVTGGGADYWSTADQAYLATKSITGDFDARVRVTKLAGANTITKAVLLAREAIDPDARGLHVSVNPVPPGRNLAQMGLRPTIGAATVNVGTNIAPSGIPNAWLRLTRAGNIFTGYYSSNNVDWVPMGQTNTAFPSSMILGLGVTAHDNALLATGSFSGLRIYSRPTLGAAAYSVGEGFSFSFDTQWGVPYAVQYKTNIDDAVWQPLTSFIGDGLLRSITNAGPGTSTRFFRAIVP